MTETDSEPIIAFKISWSSESNDDDHDQFIAIMEFLNWYSQVNNTQLKGYEIVTYKAYNL